MTGLYTVLSVDSRVALLFLTKVDFQSIESIIDEFFLLVIFKARLVLRPSLILQNHSIVTIQSLFKSFAVWSEWSFLTIVPAIPQVQIRLLNIIKKNHFHLEICTGQVTLV